MRMASFDQKLKFIECENKLSIIAAFKSCDTEYVIILRELGKNLQKLGNRAFIK